MSSTINLTEYIIEKIYNQEDSHLQTVMNENILNLLANIDLFEIAEELPLSDIKKKFYLIPKDEGQENNLYDIYVYVNEDWEKVDDFNLTDLEDIVVGGTNDYNELINKPIIDNNVTSNSNNAVKSSGIYTALQNKQDKISQLNELYDIENNTIFNDDGSIFNMVNDRIYHDYGDTNELHLYKSDETDVNFDDVPTIDDLSDIATSGSYTDLDGVTTETLRITYESNGSDVVEDITFLILDSQE